MAVCSDDFVQQNFIWNEVTWLPRANCCGISDKILNVAPLHRIVNPVASDMILRQGMVWEVALGAQRARCRMRSAGSYGNGRRSRLQNNGTVNLERVNLLLSATFLLHVVAYYLYYYQVLQQKHSLHWIPIGRIRSAPTCFVQLNSFWNELQLRLQHPSVPFQKESLKLFSIWTQPGWTKVVCSSLMIARR